MKDHHTDVLGYLAEGGVPPDLTFEQMVKDLFKVDLPGNDAPFLHACVGISGEVAELFGAPNLDNIREECGDFEFYIEAAWQYLTKEPINDIIRSESMKMRNEARHMECCMAEIQASFLLISGALLDVAKKAWVYGRPLDKKTAVEHLLALEFNLGCYYNLLAIDREMVLRQNMVKLVGKSGRYATGKYSDAQAIARADKPAGE